MCSGMEFIRETGKTVGHTSYRLAYIFTSNATGGITPLNSFVLSGRAG